MWQMFSGQTPLFIGKLGLAILQTRLGPETGKDVADVLRPDPLIYRKAWD